MSETHGKTLLERRAGQLDSLQKALAGFAAEQEPDTVQSRTDEAAEALGRTRAVRDATVRWVLAVFGVVAVGVFGSVPFIGVGNLTWWSLLGLVLVVLGLIRIAAGTARLHEPGDVSLAEVAATFADVKLTRGRYRRALRQARARLGRQASRKADRNFRATAAMASSALAAKAAEDAGGAAVDTLARLQPLAGTDPAFAAADKAVKDAYSAAVLASISAGSAASVTSETASADAPARAQKFRLPRLNPQSTALAVTRFYRRHFDPVFAVNAQLYYTLQESPERSTHLGPFVDNVEALVAMIGSLETYQLEVEFAGTPDPDPRDTAASKAWISALGADGTPSEAALKRIADVDAQRSLYLAHRTAVLAEVGVAQLRGRLRKARRAITFGAVLVGLGAVLYVGAASTPDPYTPAAVTITVEPGIAARELPPTCAEAGRQTDTPAGAVEQPAEFSAVRLSENRFALTAPTACAGRIVDFPDGGITVN